MTSEWQTQNSIKEKRKSTIFRRVFFHNFRSNYEKMLQIFAHAAGSSLKERERTKGIYRQGMGFDFRRKPRLIPYVFIFWGNLKICRQA